MPADMVFYYYDRLGSEEEIPYRKGETAAEVLLRSRIPPYSVVVLRDGGPVPDTTKLTPDGRYEARLIEGYDTNTIRRVLSAAAPSVPDAVYQKERLVFGKDGALELQQLQFDSNTLRTHVVNTVRETLRTYDIAEPEGKVAVGLSGGVDSTALTLILSELSSSSYGPKPIAITFEDNEISVNHKMADIVAFCGRNGIEHHIADTRVAESIFHTNRPINEILHALMVTADSHQVMYLDHQITRCTLEKVASDLGISAIALGLHTTDILGGLLNEYSSGFRSGPIPVRTIGSHRFIYPLVFVNKRELHTYLWNRVGYHLPQSTPNPWELHPLDRNFYYYLADMLQSFWPGLEFPLVEGHNAAFSRAGRIPDANCPNCKATFYNVDGAAPAADSEQTECDACAIMRRNGYIN